MVTGWKVGKEALALLVIGSAAILMAFWLALWGRDLLALAFLLCGCSAIGFVGYKFYYEAVVPAKRASNRIQEHTALMDSVQEAAIILTDIISQMNDYALRNAEAIVSTVDGAKDMLNKLPGGQLIANSRYFTKGDNLAKGVR